MELEEQQLREDSKGEKFLGDEKKRRVINELRRLQRQKDRVQAFPESASGQEMGDEELEDSEPDKMLTETKLEYPSSESLGSFDAQEKSKTIEETQQLFLGSFQTVDVPEEEIIRRTAEQSSGFQGEPFYHTSAPVTDLNEIKDNQHGKCFMANEHFHPYSSHYLADTSLADFQMKGLTVGLEEGTQSSTARSGSSYSYEHLWAPSESLRNEDKVISGSSANEFERDNAEIRRGTVGELQQPLRSSASSARSESVTQEEVYTEMTDSSRLSYLNPSQNFAKFLMNLGPQGVQALGPELIVQLAQQYYEETTRSSCFGCQTYEDMEDTLYNIRLLKGRIEDLERECMILKFQNES
ncbi:Protein NLP3 [Galdieria sulphuraria]|nr:Protein NLP3 [Galdieria sulphuraria]